MAAKSGLSKFTRAQAKYPPRVVGASWGDVGGGKTHFWLGAPGPIVVQSLDRGMEGVADKPEFAGKDIYEIEYDWSPNDKMTKDELKDMAIDVRDALMADALYAISNGVRTLVWDKESNIWPLFRYAEFGKANDAPKDYYPLNQRYMGVINQAKASDVNFGLIQSVRNAWEVGSRGLVKTDRKERVGFNELEALVHINIEHVREKGQFILKVGKARGPGSQDVQDQELPGNVTFAEFGQLLFPETRDTDYWE